MLRIVQIKTCLFILSIVFVVASQANGKLYAKEVNAAYLSLCLRGTADELRQAMDTYGWNANEVFTIASENLEEPELYRYFLKRDSVGPVSFAPVFLAAANKNPGVVSLLVER